MFFSSGKVAKINLKTPAVSAGRRTQLSLFQKKAGLRFRRTELLDLAFCHRSFVNESEEDVESNERLEFLGDSVLGAVAAEYLFELLPDRPEGDLARIKAHVVSEESLASLALVLGIDAVVRVGRGEENSGGRNKKSLLADSMEALIGAYYLDAGFEKASHFILRYLKVPVETVLADKHRRDYKTLLQEAVQKRYHSCPRYFLQDKTGPAHCRTFWMGVNIEGVEYGPGSGGTKKAAQQEAARIAWEALGAEFRQISSTA